WSGLLVPHSWYRISGTSVKCLTPGAEGTSAAVANSAAAAERSPTMDAQGARDLARRIGPNPGFAARSTPADVPARLLPLFRYVGGGDAVALATEPSPPARQPSLRRVRFRDR